MSQIGSGCSLRAERPHDDFVPTPETLADDTDPAQLAASAAEHHRPRQSTSAARVRTATPTALDATRPGNDCSADRALDQTGILDPAIGCARPVRRQAGLGAAQRPRRHRDRRRRPPAPTDGRRTNAPHLSSRPRHALEGLAHYWQTWNNCGPATLSMNLSYFGIKIGQDKIGPVLKPEKDDKNVGPEQLADLRALAGTQGDGARERRRDPAEGAAPGRRAGACGDVVRAEAERRHGPLPADRRLRRCSAATGGGYWIAYDSYDSHGIKKGDPYRGVHFPYDSFDKLWKVFGRTYIPIYDEGRAAAVGAGAGRRPGRRADVAARTGRRPGRT